MTNDDFKQILDEALKPIKDEQSEFRQEQSEFRQEQSELRQEQAEFRQEQAEFRKQLNEVSSGQQSLQQEVAELKNTIETRVLPPLAYLETTVKGYADSYKINDSNIRRMEKRLETLEEDAGVDVPPELKLEPLSKTPLSP